MHPVITKEYLDLHPEVIFVFGDNQLREGLGGAAKLRHHKQSYGFITKKLPSNQDDAFYKPEEYLKIYYTELHKLMDYIMAHSNYRFFISQIGSGLANKYNIWEEVIELSIEVLLQFKNVTFLWEEESNG